MNTIKKRVSSIIICSLIFALVTGLAVIPAADAKASAPKNIIVMISDGMGFNHTLSTSYYVYGRPNGQVYARFPFKMAVSTYAAADQAFAPDEDDCVDWGYDPYVYWSNFAYANLCYTDSASAATAIATGVKTYNAALGVDLDQQPVKNVVEAAEEKGKSTGVVTSVPISHATPAGFVAHNISRNDYVGLALEMIYVSAVDVIMGAGHPFYSDHGVLQKTPINFRYVGGQKTWDALFDGTAGNDADGDGTFDAWTLIQNRAEFQSLASGPTPKRVIGVAQVYSTLQQGRAGDAFADPFIVPFNPNVPTLVEMTQAALNILDDDPDGFLLMIEGGAVDWAAHSNQSGRMIEEQIDFDAAVEAVISWVNANSNWGETLLIITADHETGYLVGPGSDPTWTPIINNGAGRLPGMEWHSLNHTNSLVPFFANGDDARWFNKLAVNVDPVRGKYIDNTDIANVIFQLLGSQ
jgi:alkaline phosphatase